MKKFTQLTCGSVYNTRKLPEVQDAKNRVPVRNPGAVQPVLVQYIMKGNEMRRKQLLKHAAPLLLAAGVLAAAPLSVSANSDVGKGASKKYLQGGTETQAETAPAQGSGENWQDTPAAGIGTGDPGITESGGTSASGRGYAARDTEAPAATGAYGYGRDDAKALCSWIYSVKTDPVKKEIAESYLLNSIFYDPENVMLESSGKHLLKLYEGPKDNYRRAYLEALDGLDFFANPTVMFLQTEDGKVIVAVDTGERFTEEMAAANFATTQQLVPVIEELKAATAGKDDADKAKLISDYVANRLEYDSTNGRNCLGDALRYGVTACVGYNALTGTLFEHCGLPYISIVADEQGTDASHIFGLSKIKNSWLVFDTTNYDRKGGNEPYWIFSDKYREGQFYSNFRMVETADTFRN